jgi:hypothetical protein
MQCNYHARHKQALRQTPKDNFVASLTWSANYSFGELNIIPLHLLLAEGKELNGLRVNGSCAARARVQRQQTQFALLLPARHGVQLLHGACVGRHGDAAAFQNMSCTFSQPRSHAHAQSNYTPCWLLMRLLVLLS